VLNDYTVYYTPVSSMAIDGGRQYSDATPAPADPDDSAGYPELSQHTAEDTAATFSQLLQDNGISVQGEPTPYAAPEGVTAIATVSSATLAEIMSYTLRHSDNTLAEEFGRLTALASSGASNTPQGATEAVRRIVAGLGIDTTGLAMADCSGLSSGSQLTVRTLAAVQQRNLTLGSGAAAAEGLSIAGLVGTAQDRYTDDDVAGLLRVKTGSLGTVTSMAGNVSRTNGGALAFAVVVNNPEDYAAARGAIDSFITKLAAL
jgi:D-alanyl-D-alanine carboxypeptidase/D-alanyl-D-alanine-endopeptidase (penicillin-binding protein 4)